MKYHYYLYHTRKNRYAYFVSGWQSLRWTRDTNEIWYNEQYAPLKHLFEIHPKELKYVRLYRVAKGVSPTRHQKPRPRFV